MDSYRKVAEILTHRFVPRKRPTSIFQQTYLLTVGSRDSLRPKKNGPEKETLPVRSQERPEQAFKSGLRASSLIWHGTYVPVPLD